MISLKKYLPLIAIAFIGCDASTDSTPINTSSIVQDTEKPSETEVMVKELQALVTNGNPYDYYHWNSKIADALMLQMGQGTPQEQIDNWFEYCKQTLNAGNSTNCIERLESYLSKANLPYPEILTENTQPIFEVLALAYLRKGEQENCQHNHTPYSCILPMQAGGVHQLKTGSEKAIELYSMLYDRFPQEKYRWLINVAYMTLGEHPQKVPAKYLITFPNWELEQQSFPAFKEIAMETGLATDGLSGGTCIDDFNNDGYLDVFMTSYGMQDNVNLFLNNQQGGFEKATEKAGLKGIVSGLNCLQADYNNDGFKDILILRGAWLGDPGSHPNSLLKNMGDGTFEDVTRSSGLLSYHPTQTATWGDFDKDGYLDVFIGNESNKDQHHPCELFRNNGDGTFTEVAQQYGLGNIKGFIKGVTFGDINNDGWQDLYISVMGGNNLLYENKEGSFTEIGQSAGVHEPFFSFPCWFWDVNNDGWQDLFVSGYDLTNLDGLGGDYALELQGKSVSTDKPRLYLNQGNNTFKEVTKAYGLDKTMYAMGANFGDLDNDGYLDFYVGTGAPDFSTIVPNRMFRNVGGKRFEEVTSAGNFGHIQKGHGIGFADIDRDGDQDIYAVMGGAYEGDTFTNILYENPIDKNNWIVIELAGVATNKAAIGTRIELALNNGEKRFVTVGSGGTFGGSSLQQEIGLGSATSIKALTIHWLNSTPQTFNAIAANQKISIQEGTATPSSINYTPVPFANMQHEHHH